MTGLCRSRVETETSGQRAPHSSVTNQEKAPNTFAFGAHLNAAMHFAGIAKFFRGFFCREACASCGHIDTACRMDFEFGRRDWTRTNDPHHVKVVF